MSKTIIRRSSPRLEPSLFDGWGPTADVRLGPSCSPAAGQLHQSSPQLKATQGVERSRPKSAGIVPPKGLRGVELRKGVKSIDSRREGRGGVGRNNGKGLLLLLLLLSCRNNAPTDMLERNEKFVL